MQRKKIRAINLGDIVTPNFEKSKQKAGDLISKMKNIHDEEGKKTIQGQVTAVVAKIYPFLKETHSKIMQNNEYYLPLITAFKEIANIDFTPADIDCFLDAMYPAIDSYIHVLQEAIDFNDGYNQEFRFLSDTTKRDMDHLKEDLASKNIAFTLDENGELASIGGIRLRTTYVTKQARIPLIEEAISTTYINSDKKVVDISTLFSASNPDIKYIRGVNKVEDPLLKQALDVSFKQADQSTQKKGIETIVWLKKEGSDLVKSFHDMLHAETPPVTFVPVAKL